MHIYNDPNICLTACWGGEQISRKTIALLTSYVSTAVELFLLQVKGLVQKGQNQCRFIKLQNFA